MIISCNTFVDRRDHVQYLAVSKSYSDKLVRLYPAAPGSQVKHSTTEPLHSLFRKIRKTKQTVIILVFSLHMYHTSYFFLAYVDKIIMYMNIAHIHVLNIKYDQMK